MLRTIAMSYWTALALGIAALALHVRWYTVGKAAGGEVMSGFGAVLVVLGVLVATRPYLREGPDRAAWKIIVPPRRLKDLPPEEAFDQIGPASRAALIRHARLRQDILVERYVAVIVIAAGTLLNGYGPLVARLLHLRASVP